MRYTNLLLTLTLSGVICSFDFMQLKELTTVARYFCHVTSRDSRSNFSAVPHGMSGTHHVTREL